MYYCKDKVGRRQSQLEIGSAHLTALNAYTISRIQNFSRLSGLRCLFYSTSMVRTSQCSHTTTQFHMIVKLPHAHGSLVRKILKTSDLDFEIVAPQSGLSTRQPTQYRVYALMVKHHWLRWRPFCMQGQRHLRYGRRDTFCIRFSRM